MGNVQDAEADPNQNGNSRPPDRPPKPAPYPPVSAVYPTINNDDGDYEILNPNPDYNRPSRPAPPRPAPVTPPGQSSSLTLLSSHGGLEGVPFIINPRFLNSSSSDKLQIPFIKARTMQQLMKDYDYSFSVERQ